MKDSMGELTFTIIIIVAAGLILAFVTAMLSDDSGLFSKIKGWWDNTEAYNYDSSMIENI
ncbi:MAG TPA: hypothetical protein PLT65_00400 [Bacilli bacterium]|nr:hypothetical protein [Bacilli bacterium]